MLQYLNQKIFDIIYASENDTIQKVGNSQFGCGEKRTFIYMVEWSSSSAFIKNI